MSLDGQAALEALCAAETKAEGEGAGVRANIMQDMESTTTAWVETAAENEARMRSEVMKNLADAKPWLESTTTVHVETAAEMEARVRSEVMKAKPRLEGTTTSHVETAAEMEARIEDKVIQDMLAAQPQLWDRGPDDKGHACCATLASGTEFTRAQTMP